MNGIFAEAEKKKWCVVAMTKSMEAKIGLFAIRIHSLVIVAQFSHPLCSKGKKGGQEGGNEKKK